MTHKTMFPILILVACCGPDGPVQRDSGPDVVPIDAPYRCSTDADTEPNDHLEEAIVVTATAYQQLGMQLCPSNDIDMLEVSLVNGREVAATVTTDLNHDGMVVDLFTIDGSTLASAISVGNNALELRYLPTETDTAYLRVASELGEHQYSILILQQ